MKPSLKLKVQAAAAPREPLARRLAAQPRGQGEVDELQRALQSDREVDAAAEVEEVVGVAVVARHLADLVVALEHLGDLGRDGRQRLGPDGLKPPVRQEQALRSSVGGQK